MCCVCVCMSVIVSACSRACVRVSCDKSALYVHAQIHMHCGGSNSRARVMRGLTIKLALSSLYESDHILMKNAGFIPSPPMSQHVGQQEQ